MHKYETLKDINIGNSVAEHEAQRLADYFIETNVSKQLLDGNIDIVYGAKGTGKSALYLLLFSKRNEMLGKNIHLIQGENVSETTVFSSLDTEPYKSEDYFCYIWKLYILSLLGNYIDKNLRGLDDARIEPLFSKLRDAGLMPVTGLAKILANVSSFLNRIEKIEGNASGAGISLREPTSEQSHAGISSVQELINEFSQFLADFNISVWILLDRLDVAFTKNETETPALRALFRVYNDFSGLSNLKLKIFLRDDIWSRITKEAGFREQSHIVKKVTIDWGDADLRYLIITRFFSNTAFERYTGLDKNKVLNDSVLQLKAFEYIFPEQIEVGSRQSKTFSWLLKRVEDGKQSRTPRELIQLISEAKNKELRLGETGQVNTEINLLSSTSLKTAHDEVSKTKVETLYAEYPELRKIIDAFKGSKTEHSQKTITDLLINNSIGNDAIGVIKELLEKGFLQEKRGLTGEIKYWIPFIFRPYLEMTQGKA